MENIYCDGIVNCIRNKMDKINENLSMIENIKVNRVALGLTRGMVNNQITSLDDENSKLVLEIDEQESGLKDYIRRNRSLITNVREYNVFMEQEVEKFLDSINAI